MGRHSAVCSTIPSSSLLSSSHGWRIESRMLWKISLQVREISIISELYLNCAVQVTLS